jgi:hypothetical protein
MIDFSGKPDHGVSKVRLSWHAWVSRDGRQDCSGSLSMVSPSCINFSIASLLKRQSLLTLNAGILPARARLWMVVVLTLSKLATSGDVSIRSTYLHRRLASLRPRAGIPKSIRLSRSAHCIPAFRAIQQINHFRRIREPSLLAFKTGLFTHISAFPAAQVIRLNDTRSPQKGLYTGQTAVDDAGHFAARRRRAQGTRRVKAQALGQVGIVLIP